MRFNRLDLNLLFVLDTLLSELSVTKTAKRLYLGQPAVSAALARLREHYQDELLIQVGRRMEPTPLAQNLALPIKEALNRMQIIANVRPHFDPLKAQRRFTLTVSDYIGTILMPSLNRALEEQAPGIQITIRPTALPVRHGVHPVVEALDRRNNDFAIMPAEYASNIHSAEPLLKDTYTCIAWEGNTHIGKRLTLEKYLELTHAVAEFDEGRIRSRDTIAIEALGHKRNIGVITEGFTTLPYLIVGTRMIATVQTRLARLYAQTLPLRLLTLPFHIPPIVETIQWHKFKDHDQTNIWFRQLLHRVAAELGPPAPRRQSRAQTGGKA